MFHEWSDFYLLIGSAAAALIGLLFVVATLMSGVDRSRAMVGARIYMTPVVFHFGVVLSVAAVAMAPKVGANIAGSAIGAAALAGLVYTGFICLQLGRGKVPDTPHWSDFWCYGVAPFVVYLALAAAAALVWVSDVIAADVTGAACLALLLVCVRNAWDLVTYLAAGLGDKPDEPAEKA
jgi:hypothetical protein